MNHLSLYRGAVEELEVKHPSQSRAYRQASVERFPHCIRGVCHQFLAKHDKMSCLNNSSTVKRENKMKPSNLFIISIAQVMRVVKNLVILMSSFWYQCQT